MASYAIVATNPTAGTGDGTVIALVVTDGQHTLVYGEHYMAEQLRDDVDWPVSDDERAVLATGLTGLSYFSVDGPHTFEGDAKTAGPVLARTYALA